MSVWNPDNVRDIAESVGISALADDALSALTSDVEYRLTQVLEEALRLVRRAGRSTLTIADISHALRLLDVEPLYGYDSTRPLRFGEASIGPGQPLFYVQDEEIDFEKLINAPLPKVPREITFTAHWLAVEGVQPSIPQNPTAADARSQELLPKGPGANPHLAALSGADNVAVKPLVKHVLSRELQLYFEKIATALLDQHNEDYRDAALASLRSDPGLHQLVPYFVQFVAEKVTHGLSSLFTLNMMLHMTAAILDNGSLFVDPYVSSLVPPVLTCLVGPRLGASPNPLEHYPLRSLAASMLGRMAAKFAKTTPTLKSRLARTCLKHFLDPRKPFAVHFGALRGICAVGGREAVRALVVPNLADYGAVLREGLDAGPPADKDAEMVVGAVLEALASLEADGPPLPNGHVDDDGPAAYRARLEARLGPLLAERVLREGRMELVQAVLNA